MAAVGEVAARGSGLAGADTWIPDTWQETPPLRCLEVRIAAIGE